MIYKDNFHAQKTGNVRRSKSNKALVAWRSDFPQSYPQFLWATRAYHSARLPASFLKLTFQLDGNALHSKS